MASLYLLHIDPPYVGKQRNPDAKRIQIARHYFGYTNHLKQRVAEHQAGGGARLCQVAVEAGCRLLLVRTWSKATRAEERRLKNHRNAPRLCPICNPNGAGTRGLPLPVPMPKSAPGEPFDEIPF